MVDRIAARVGDNVTKFKAACRDLIADANSGQLKAQLEADEAARNRPWRSPSSPKKDPQAETKAKARADKLKSDIEKLLPPDNYPHLKADIFKVIDPGVEASAETKNSSKFGDWATRYLKSLKDLVNEKSKTKYGIEYWCEQQEPADVTLEENIDSWTYESIFKAGKTGVAISTADGIIRVTQESKAGRYCTAHRYII